jgi:hypothetical protein
MTFRGNEQLLGQPAVRVDYVVSPLLGKVTLRTATGQAEVGYRGAYWIDPTSFDLIRMDVSADEIPSQLRLAGMHIQIDYNTLTTRETRALRTQHSAIEVVTSAGDVHRDEINFTHCRQFAGEATLLSGSNCRVRLT